MRNMRADRRRHRPLEERYTSGRTRNGERKLFSYETHSVAAVGEPIGEVFFFLR